MDAQKLLGEVATQLLSGAIDVTRKVAIAGLKPE